MKPMSERQRNSIKACEYLLGIKYEGKETAQGAFFYLREHIDNAREELNRRIKEEQKKYRPKITNISNDFNGAENDIVEQMSFYRYDDAEHDLGDEDETYAETPTRESLDRDIRYWLSFL